MLYQTVPNPLPFQSIYYEQTAHIQSLGSDFSTKISISLIFLIRWQGWPPPCLVLSYSTISLKVPVSFSSGLSGVAARPSKLFLHFVLFSLPRFFASSAVLLMPYVIAVNRNVATLCSAHLARPGSGGTCWEPIARTVPSDAQRIVPVGDENNYKERKLQYVATTRINERM